MILIGLNRDNSESEPLENPIDNSDDSEKLVTDILASTVDNLLEAECTNQSGKDDILEESGAVISPKKETKSSPIFLFSTGFGDWSKVDSSASDYTSSYMDTASDDEGNNPDSHLSCSRDEDSQSDVSNLTNIAITESFSTTDLSQIDGECDMTGDCEEKEDAKILSPLSESGMSSSSGSPPWFLSDAELTESKKEEEKESPFKLKACDITLEKIEAKSNGIKDSPKKADNSESEPDYVELDSDSEEEVEPDNKGKCDIELVPFNPDLDDDDIVELDGDDDEDDDVIKIRALPAGVLCKDCCLRGSQITLYNPGEGASQAEIVRDSRVSPVEWEDVKLKEVTYIVRNIIIYDSHGHMVPVDQGILESNKARLYFSGRIKNRSRDFELEVDRIQIADWKRDGDDKLVLISNYTDKKIQYKVEDVSKKYKKALATICYSSLSNKPQRSSPIKSSPKVKNDSPNNSKIDPNLVAVLNTMPKEYQPSPKPKVYPTNSANKKPAPKPSRKVMNVSEDDDSEGEGQTSNKKKREVNKVLKSFNASPGFGDSLKKLLPKEFKNDADHVACLLLFINERQNMWFAKYHNRVKLTDNVVMMSQWFTNMYRELDRGTQYFQNCLLSTTLAGYKPDLDGLDENIIKKTLWKSVVYRLSNKVQTFKKLGGIPDVENFKSFKRGFLKVFAEGSKSNDPRDKAFTAAHQNNGCRRYFESLEVVRRDLDVLTKKITKEAKKRSAKGVFEVLSTVQGCGNFFAWQILCDLTESRVLGPVTDNQWTKLGPGAQMGLRMVFDGLTTTKGELKYTRLLRDLCAPSGSKSGFRALGLQFPAFLDKPLSLKNVEHALCEYSKYYRMVQGKPAKSRDFKAATNVYLDVETPCSICDKVGDTSTGARVMCALCRNFQHKSCDDRYATKYCEDGTWLCRRCHRVEKAWGREDFDFQENDPSDDHGKAYKRGEGGSKKKEALAKARASKIAQKKAEKAAKQNIQVELVTLSSDEEDVDDEDLDIGDLDSDDDIMLSDEDPFSTTEDWALANESSNSGTDFDDDIQIVSITPMKKESHNKATTSPKKNIHSAKKSSPSPTKKQNTSTPKSKSPKEKWVTPSFNKSTSTTSPRKRKESPTKEVSPSKKSPSKLVQFREMMTASLRKPEKDSSPETTDSDDDEIMIL